MMTDPIADMLTRIRNALRIERPSVEIPSSRVKQGIAEVLQREGYIWDFEIVEQSPQNVIRLNLKYGPNGEDVIQSIQRVSKPGRRVYARNRDSEDVLQGLGISVISTSHGVLSNREASEANMQLFFLAAQSKARVFPTEYFGELVRRLEQLHNCAALLQRARASSGRAVPLIRGTMNGAAHPCD